MSFVMKIMNVLIIIFVGLPLHKIERTIKRNVCSYTLKKKEQHLDGIQPILHFQVLTISNKMVDTVKVVLLIHPLIMMLDVQRLII
jgi:hypothetical protein